MRRGCWLSWAFAMGLCLWLGAATDPEKKGFPKNALRGTVEATRTEEGGWKLHYHKTGKLDLSVSQPTLDAAKQKLLKGLQEAGETQAELQRVTERIAGLEASATEVTK